MEKKAMHALSGWAMFTKCSLDAAENKLNYYRGRDCIEKLRKKLKDHAMKIINCKEKEIIPLIDEENNSYKEQEVCHICKKKFCLDENDENFKKHQITLITPENLEEPFIAFAI